ncbi:MAG TPA: DUF5719 family protein [Acidimicrobiales bacterium]|nr:DUF5719 family protein [Acidimicrobiales bacterium]
MRVPRLLVLVVLAGALVAAFAVDRAADAPTAAVGPPPLDRALPVVAPDDVLGATWYCAAGSTDPDGPADHVVVLANSSDVDRQATVSAFAGRDDPVVADVAVAAGSVARLELAELVEAPAVAALVEVDGGGVTVGHELSGAAGTDVGPCASSPSSTWYLAWGDTSRDARQLVALFNPFPDDAVLDLEFATSEGARVPSAFEGLVVPGRSVIVADVGAEVTRRDQVAATIVARSGRVVAERIQVLDGTVGRQGLAVDLAVPTPLEAWSLPGGTVVEGRVERLVVFNPGDRTAEIDIELRPDDPAEFGGIEPFELSVAAGDVAVLDLPEEPRVADVALGRDLGYQAVVRSLNGVGIVVERVTIVPPDADGRGLAVTAASPVVADTWVVPALPTSLDGARLVLTNPSSDTIVVARLEVLGPDGTSALDPDTVELAAAGRIDIDLAARVDIDDLAGAALVIRADGPVTAAVRGTTSSPADRFDAVAVPAAASLQPVAAL